jgi:hypothetical protein
MGGATEANKTWRPTAKGHLNWSETCCNFAAQTIEVASTSRPHSPYLDGPARPLRDSCPHKTRCKRFCFHTYAVRTESCSFEEHRRESVQIAPPHPLPGTVPDENTERPKNGRVELASLVEFSCTALDGTEERSNVVHAMCEIVVGENLGVATS